MVVRLLDKSHKWSALNRLVPDMLAAGMIGCPFVCPDMIGGGQWVTFLPGSPFEPELFIRSAQVHALSPMMQISASPWRVLDKRYQAIFKSIIDLRQRFVPRIEKLVRHSAKSGEPIMRSLEYVFPNHGYAEIKDQFMVGDDLLVAPVLEKGAKYREVVLPPGEWIADDGQMFIGNCRIRVSTPIERLPYFVLKAKGEMK
jgi:alpha-glucosidase